MRAESEKLTRGVEIRGRKILCEEKVVVLHKINIIVTIYDSLLTMYTLYNH